MQLGQFLLINKLLQDPSAWESMVVSNELTSDYFYKCKAEFEFIKAHVATYGTTPSRLVFKDSFPEFEIMDVTDSPNFILDQLMTEYNRSYLAQSFMTIKQLLENDSDSEKAVDTFLKLQDGLKRGGMFTYTDILEDEGRYDHFLSDSAKYVSTGFKELDDYIGGIDLENENMVIAARTGIGKSWTLMAMASSCAKRGMRVGYYSGEMALTKVGYRVDTLLGGVDNKRIMRGDLSYSAAYRNYFDTTLADIRANGGHFFVLTPSDIGGRFASVDTLRAFIKRAKLDILFIDQYSLMESSSKSTKEHEKIADISKNVKNLQVATLIPIVSVTQNNRTGEKGEDGHIEQDSTQIAGSDRIPQDATVIIMLDREVNDDNPDDEKLIMNIIKARDGGDHRKIVYKANFNVGKFTFIPKANSAEEAQEMINEYESEEVFN